MSMKDAHSDSDFERLLRVRNRKSTSLCVRDALQRLIEVHATVRTIVDSYAVLCDRSSLGTHHGVAVRASGTPLHHQDDRDRNKTPAYEYQDHQTQRVAREARWAARTHDHGVESSPRYGLFHSFPHRHCGILTGR
jgi:hypothetical protein